MDKSYKKKLFCRCCKKKDLFNYINLGAQPLANSYHKDEKLSKYELAVNVCKNCFHNQLSVVVDPDSMFKNYLYVSGTTKTFRKHTKNLAIDAVKRSPKKRLRVLDIACNDGTQLEYFRELGCDVVGVDPAVNLRKITKKKNLKVEVAYWNTDLAKKYKEKFDIMTGTNVFAHVDDLDEFLSASKIALKKDGILILEFPYANKMIENNEFDTVYHEHLSYFLANSFNTLVIRLGFRVVDLLQTKIHGGSIRFFLMKGEGKESTKIKTLIAKEKKNGLLDTLSYKNFKIRVEKNKKDMKMLFNKLSTQNKKIIGYGASAKGNTMLNYFKIKPSYIIDDNELKWGYKTPGMNISIVPPKTLRAEDDEIYVIILSWNFFSEIVGKILALAPDKKKIKFITYVPEVKIYDYKNAKYYNVSA